MVSLLPAEDASGDAAARACASANRDDTVDTKNPA